MTLLEAVVALAIVGLAGVAALATAGSELRAAGRARRAIEAAALADQSLSTVALLGVEDLDALPDSLARGSFPAPLDEYQWRMRSRAVPAQRDMYDVSVEILWPEGGSYTAATRLYRTRPVLAAR